jgi:3-oxoacyl-[acyl-carrier-protein] synthase III
MGTVIQSIGYYLPEKLVSNDELLELVGKNGGTNVDLEGLKKKLVLNKAEKRYFKRPSETGLDMSVHAAKKCLANASFAPQDLDLILYVGMLRDYVEPAMSVLLQDILGAGKANAFDISNACMGFLYGMETASLYIESGLYQNILIVGAEDGSERIPWHLFSSGDESLKGFSALTVSDGTAAMLLQSKDSSSNFKQFSFKTANITIFARLRLAKN